MTADTPSPVRDDSAAVISGAGGAGDPRDALAAVRNEIGKAVVGQDQAVTGLIIALLCRGHVLLEGVPGVAKTLLVRALAAALALDTRRIQVTPDRTPPKTQAALLEAMEERQVSVEGTPRPLPEPFLVAATQNPVEYEGTYPLPEAQLDRFLMKLTIPVPGRAEEIGMLTRHAAGFSPRDLGAAGLRPVAGRDDLDVAQQAVHTVRVAPEVTSYIVDLCRATRGATALLATSRAWAWLAGRKYVTPDDVKALARPTLRHRIQLRPEAELEGASPDGVLEGVLASVPVPR